MIVWPMWRMHMQVACDCEVAILYQVHGALPSLLLCCSILVLRIWLGLRAVCGAVERIIWADDGQFKQLTRRARACSWSR